MVNGYLWCPNHNLLYECDRWMCPECQKKLPKKGIIDAIAPILANDFTAAK